MGRTSATSTGGTSRCTGGTRGWASRTARRRSCSRRRPVRTARRSWNVGAGTPAPPVRVAALRARGGVGRSTSPRSSAGRRAGRGHHRRRAADARPAARPGGGARRARRRGSWSRCPPTTGGGPAYDAALRAGIEHLASDSRRALRRAAPALRRRDRRRLPRAAPRAARRRGELAAVRSRTRRRPAQRGLVAAADLVLAGRYHPLVFAVSAHVPVVPIAYEHKATGVANAAGIGDVALTADGLTGPGLIAAIDDVVARSRRAPRHARRDRARGCTRPPVGPPISPRRWSTRDDGGSAPAPLVVSPGARTDQGLHPHRRRRDAPGCSTAAASPRTVPAPRRTAPPTRSCRALGLARAECERRLRARRAAVRLQRELFVVGAELATAPDNRRKLTDGTTRVTAGDGGGARADHRRRHRRASTRRSSSCCRARTASRPRSTSPAPRAPRRAGVRHRDPRRLARARQPGRAVPQPARRPVLDSRPLAGRPLTAPPAATTEPTDPRGGSVPISFTVASTAPGRAKADVLAVPVTAGGDARRRRRRRRPPGSRGRSTRSWSEAGFEGKPGQTLVVPLDGAHGASALLVGLGDGRRRHARRAPHRGGARRAAGVEVGARRDDARSTPRPTSSTRRAVGQAIAEGFAARQLLVRRVPARRRRPRSSARVVLLVEGGAAAVKKGVGRGEVVAGAVAWARDMVNTPARELSPDQFAEGRAAAAARARASRSRCSTSRR